MRPIQKRLDGSGVIRFQCSSGAFELLKMQDMPLPSELLGTDGRRKPRNMFKARRPGGCSTAYRVALPPPEGWTGKRFPTKHFVLGAGHINETLVVLAEYWRAQGVDFIGITNEFGNLFDNVAMHGFSLPVRNVIRVGEGDVPD